MYRKLTEKYRRFENGPCCFWDQVEIHHTVNSLFNFPLASECLIYFCSRWHFSCFNAVCSHQHSPSAVWRTLGRHPAQLIRLQGFREASKSQGRAMMLGPWFLVASGVLGQLLSKAFSALVGLLLRRDHLLCSKAHHGRSVGYSCCSRSDQRLPHTFRHCNVDFWCFLRAEECRKN